MKPSRIYIYLVSLFLILFCNSCCKYTVRSAFINLKFNGISDKEFDNMVITTDNRNVQNFTTKKVYSPQYIELEFSMESSQNINQIYTVVNDSIYQDTLKNIQLKMIKEAKRCGDYNELGTSFTYNNQHYNFQSRHEISIER